MDSQPNDFYQVLFIVVKVTNINDQLLFKLEAIICFLYIQKLIEMNENFFDKNMIEIFSFLNTMFLYL